MPAAGPTDHIGEIRHQGTTARIRVRGDDPPGTPARAATTAIMPSMPTPVTRTERPHRSPACSNAAMTVATAHPAVEATASGIRPGTSSTA